MSILTEELPHYGKVPLCVFVGRSDPKRAEIIDFVKRHGGQIVPEHECYSFQVSSQEDFKRMDFYPGFVYSFDWLKACARWNKLVQPDIYRIANVPPSRAGKRINFQNSRPIYSIREALKLFDISRNQQQEYRRYVTKRGMSKKYWQFIEQQEYIPGRTEESLRSFFKKWSPLYAESPEKFVEKLKAKNYPYSLN
jgi:hypothetical protein